MGINGLGGNNYNLNNLKIVKKEETKPETETTVAKAQVTENSATVAKVKLNAVPLETHQAYALGRIKKPDSQGPKVDTCAFHDFGSDIGKFRGALQDPTKFKAGDTVRFVHNGQIYYGSFAQMGEGYLWFTAQGSNGGGWAFGYSQI